MITEDYCSFEVAKLLKEKGFDVPVNYEYHYKITIPQFHRKKHNFNGIEYSNCSSEWYSVPTHQMAMKWLREIYDIFIVVRRGLTGTGWVYSHEIYKDSKCWYARYGASYDTYEEAIEAAIKYCLENLIQ